MSTTIYEKEGYRIIGACIEVYRNKGCGFPEALYQECLGMEFVYRQIPFVSQPEIRDELESWKRNKLIDG